MAVPVAMVMCMMVMTVRAGMVMRSVRVRTRARVVVVVAKARVVMVVVMRMVVMHVRSATVVRSVVHVVLMSVMVAMDRSVCAASSACGSCVFVAVVASVVVVIRVGGDRTAGRRA